MNYEQVYNALIDKRRNKEPLSKDKGYCEEHHVIPKSLGGKDAKENLVNLTAREHFIAHKLLKRIMKRKHGANSEEYRKMTSALFFITQIRRKDSRVIVSSREYAVIKEQFAYVNSLANSGEKHWNYGQHWDDAVKKKIGDANRGRKMPEGFGEKTARWGKDNPNYGHRWTEEQRARAGARRKGIPLPESARQKLREFYKTHDSPMKGINIKDLLTPEAYAKMLERRSVSMKKRAAMGLKPKNPYDGLSPEERKALQERMHQGHKRRWEAMTPEEREAERAKKREANRKSLIARMKKKEEMLAQGITPVKKRWYTNGETDVLRENQPDGYTPGRCFRKKRRTG